MSTATLDRKERTKHDLAQSVRSSPGPDRTLTHRHAGPKNEKSRLAPTRRSAPKDRQRPRQPKTVREDGAHIPTPRKPFGSEQAEKPQNLKTTNWASWLECLSAAKILTLFTAVIAIGLFVPFTADLLTAWPFHRASLLMDAAFSACALLLGLLTWHTMREIS